MTDDEGRAEARLLADTLTDTQTDGPRSDKTGRWQTGIGLKPSVSVQRRPQCAGCLQFVISRSSVQVRSPASSKYRYVGPQSSVAHLLWSATGQHANP